MEIYDYSFIFFALIAGLGGATFWELFLKLRYGEGIVEYTRKLKILISLLGIALYLGVNIFLFIIRDGVVLEIEAFYITASVFALGALFSLFCKSRSDYDKLKGIIILVSGMFQLFFLFNWVFIESYVESFSIGVLDWPNNMMINFNVISLVYILKFMILLSLISTQLRWYKKYLYTISVLLVVMHFFDWYLILN